MGYTQSPEVFTVHSDNYYSENWGPSQETLGITVELDITSQILSFLTYGGSSTVKTVNKTSFNMRWMLRVEVEVPLLMGLL
jgi:hypothetical protein